MNEVKINKYGQGKKKIIFFPGWVYPIENEPVFLNKLAQKYTVITVLLPGYFGNLDSVQFLDFEKIINQISLQISKYEGDELVLAGFSQGCILASMIGKRIKHSQKVIYIGFPFINPSFLSVVSWLLKSDILINWLRKSEMIKIAVVNQVLKKLTGNQSYRYQPDRVTMTGAFDSLAGLIKTNFRPKVVSSALYIYGQHDPFLRQLPSQLLSKTAIINQAGHHPFSGYEDELIRMISQYLD